MIHSHGMPIGGKREDAAKFLAGRHALVPFPRKDDLGIVADVCKSFVRQRRVHRLEGRRPGRRRRLHAMGRRLAPAPWIHLGTNP